VIREFLVDVLADEANVEVTAVCSTGNELRSAMASQCADVVVTDVRISPTRGDEGIRIARRLQVTNPETGVVMLSQYAEPAHALALLESTSARAYLLKERIRRKGELAGAIKAVAQGGTSIDPEIVDSLIAARSRGASSPLSELAPNRRELLALIAEGKGGTAIGESLGQTPQAVERDIKAVFAELNVPDPERASRRAQAALVFLAQEGGERERV
jgi:DNA-binding NarL/FixJ family response regulator